jgi:hypothetical protein
MATIAATFGKAEIQITARGRVHRTLAFQEEPGGLYPLKSAAFQVDEYRMMSGWPVPVPDGDIRIDCLVSAEGDVLANRNAPVSLVTAADMRWVADGNYYDQTTLRWAPVQGSSSPWETTAGFAPTLVTDYTYLVGDEKFVNMTALNFDSDTTDFMWNNLSLSMGGTLGYTVIMVFCPNSIYGNAAGVVANALWSPNALDEYWVLFSVANKAVYLTTESAPAQLGVAVGNALSSTAPSYLALVVSRPQTTMYVSSGGGTMLSKSLTTASTPASLNTDFRLGGSPISGQATMDMALLDLGIYGSLLSRAEVTTEFAKLSQVYGV